MELLHRWRCHNDGNARICRATIVASMFVFIYTYPCIQFKLTLHPVSDVGPNQQIIIFLDLRPFRSWKDACTMQLCLWGDAAYSVVVINPFSTLGNKQPCQDLSQGPAVCHHCQYAYIIVYVGCTFLTVAHSNVNMFMEQPVLHTARAGASSLDLGGGGGLINQIITYT